MGSGPDAPRTPGSSRGTLLLLSNDRLLIGGIRARVRVRVTFVRVEGVMPELAQTRAAAAPSAPPVAAPPHDVLQDPLTQPAPAATAKRDKVVAYLTQNSTTHHTDEVPEALSALKANHEAGLGKKKLLPISDPYADGTSTYGGTLGAASKQLTWWHDDPSLQEGQVRMGDQVLTLGGGADADPAAIGGDWEKVMAGIGMGKESVAAVKQQLLTDEEGNPKLPASGPGAVNELLQLARTFDRAEQGEFDLDTMVLSGHHYQGTPYLFGEQPGHVYDTNDALDVRDVAGLAGAFPKAAGQVKNFQFSACNTHDLGLTGPDGEEVSTNDFLQASFPNLERTSHWEGIAAGASTAALHGGEFLTDAAKAANGDRKAFGDATWRKNPNKGEMKRSEKGVDGKLTPSLPAGTASSYTTQIGGKRGNNTAYTKRADLAPYLMK